MRAWSSARFTVPLPEGHRFPITKYQRIRDAVVARGLLAPHEVEEPDRVERWALGLVHGPEYIEAVAEGSLSALAVRRLGFPWSEALLERSLRTVQGTVEAGLDALGSGAGINLAGGTHHAFAAHGEGFCVFNDTGIVIETLRAEFGPAIRGSRSSAAQPYLPPQARRLLPPNPLRSRLHPSQWPPSRSAHDP